MRSCGFVSSALGVAALAGLAPLSSGALISPPNYPIADRAAPRADTGGGAIGVPVDLRGVTCNPITDGANCHTADLTQGATFSNLGAANYRVMDNFTPASSNPTQLCWIGRYQNRVNPIANESFRVRIFSDDGGLPNLAAGPIFERVFIQSGTAGTNKLELACLAGDACPGTPDPAAGGHWVFSAEVAGGFPVAANGCYWLEVANIGSSGGGCTADWDGNGTVNSTDISSFLTGWLNSLQQGNLAADFDGNGFVNSTDISAFLTAWLGQIGGTCGAGALFGWVGSNAGNDLASLQAIDGAYTTFSRVAGDRSFCFSGGVNPFLGNCMLPPMPPVCTNDEANGTGGGAETGTIFRSNLPGSNGGGVFTPFEIADNFSFDAPQTVTSICANGYWGLTPAGGGAVPAAPAVPDDPGLRVTYYTNSGSLAVPGEPVPLATFNLGDPGVSFVDNGSTTAYVVSITHPAVSFAADTCYWVSIARVNTFGEPEFFWTDLAGTAPSFDNRITFRSHLNSPAGPWGGADGFNVGWLLSAGPTTGMSCFTDPPPPPPANDDCGSAIAVAVPSSTNGTTLGATLETVPACAGVDGDNPSPGVWYSVVGTGRVMTASMCASPAPYDGQMSVFSGTCGGLVCVAGGDDTCGQGGGPSAASWQSTAGTVYLIMVHGWGGATGDFRLDVSSN